MLTMAPPACAGEGGAGEGLGEEEDGLEVDVDHRVPVGLGEVDGVGAADDAGVVDEDVEGAERQERLRRLGGGVEGEGEAGGLQALGGDEVEGRGDGRAAGGDDLGAGAGEAEGDGLADAGVGAGDEGAAAVEAEGVGHRRRVHRDHVHVAVVDVVAGHRPDEGVGGGAGAGVDRPGRRDRAFLAGADDVAGLGRARPSGGGRGRSRGRRCRGRPPCGGRGRGRAWCSTPSRARGG